MGLAIMEAYQQLEREFQAFVGMNQGEMVACASGTAALHLALEALELPQGSKVLMSDYNMIACPRAATLAGLVPSFVDCDEELLLDENIFNTSGWSRDDCKSILPVHIYGRKCNTNLIVSTSHVLGLAVLEDMSEIHGIQPHHLTDAACWSFYKNKIIAGEEGGMIYFKDPVRAKIARELRSLGFDSKHDYLHRPRGHNYRLSNAHAELILKSLHKFPENNAKREQIEDWYNKYIPKEWQMPLRDAVWVYDLRIPDLGYQRLDFIIRELNAKSIAARHGFKPMTMQAEYISEQINPNAEKAGKEVLYLPVSPSMTELEVKFNSHSLQEVAEKSLNLTTDYGD